MRSSEVKTAYMYRLGSTDQGTPGIMACEGTFWHSLELPDRDNRSNVSRIPSGEYVVQRRYSPSFKRTTYWLKGTSPRSYILVHGANFAGDVDKGWQSHLQGCITLGTTTGRAKNRFGNMQKCVFGSKRAVKEMESFFENKEFKLIIKDV